MGQTTEVDGAALQPEGDELPQGAAPADDLDRPLTVREYMAGIGGLRQEVGRTLQSRIDKADHRITERLRTDLAAQDRTVKELEALGVTIDPAIRERLRQGRVVEGLTAGQPEPRTPDGRGQTPGSRQETVGAVNPVSAATEAAWTIMTEEYGVVVEQADPEFSLIDLSTNRPSVFLRSIETAAKAKATRLAGGGAAPESEPERPAARPRARIPVRGNQPAPKSFEGMKSIDLFKLGYDRSTKG